MYKNKKFYAMSLLLALLTSGSGSVLAEGETDQAAEVSAVETHDEIQADMESDETATASTHHEIEVKTEEHLGVVVVPIAPAATDGAVSVKSMQDNAEQALAQGESKTNTSDRIFALLALLGLGAFAFLRKNKSNVSSAVETGSTESVREEAIEAITVETAAVTPVEAASDVRADTDKTSRTEPDDVVALTAEPEVLESVVTESSETSDAEDSMMQSESGETTETPVTNQPATAQEVPPVTRTKTTTAIPKQSPKQSRNKPQKRGKGR